MKLSETMRNELNEMKKAHKAELDRLWAAGDRKEFHRVGAQFAGEEDELTARTIRQEYLDIEVGDGATICLWSDREACTVIRRTAKTLYVQRDKATLDPSFKPEYIPGGFSAHCTNDGEQKWIIERDPNGAVTRFNWSEKKGRWQSGSDGSIRLKLGRHEHYDYNF